MPSFGGMSPYPRRFGGGRPRLQDILESFNADRGDAFDASNTQSIVYVEGMGLARAVSAAWGTNERLGHLWDAVRMPNDVVVRWEKILKLAPATTDSWKDRREVIEAIFKRFGKAATIGPVSAVLEEELGEAFVGVEYIDYDNAYIQVPDGSYPWGSVGATSPWSSNVAHVLVRLQKPDGWTEGEFYEAANKVALILEPALPVWTTFDFYRAGPTSVNVPGGPSGGGFFLDDESNLDNQVFDS